MQIAGIVKDVSKQRSGKNVKGDWTMQWVEFVDGRRVKVWTRPDLSSAKNKHLTIDGATDDTDRDGKMCFSLSPDEGSIKVEERQPGTQVPVGAVGNGGMGWRPENKPVRTIDDYESVFKRARAFVMDQLGFDNQDAIASLLQSYMAAYVRGDFAVPADDDADGEKVPF